MEPEEPEPPIIEPPVVEPEEPTEPPQELEPIEIPYASTDKEETTTIFKPEEATTVAKEHNLSFILDYQEWLENKKNQAYKMDVLPTITESKYYVPIRFLSYSLNVPQENVHWDNLTKTATIVLNSKTFTQTVGDNFVTVDGVKYPITQKAYLDRGRVLIPIKDLAALMITEPYDIYYSTETGECIVIYTDDTVTDRTQYILLPDII